MSQRVRHTYGGYAHSQLRKLRNIAEQRPDKREKFARHLFRLYEQGRQLLTDGDMDIRVSDPEALRAASAAPVEEITARFDELDAEFKQLESSLPEQPDLEAVGRLLVGIRLEQLQRQR